MGSIIEVSRQPQNSRRKNENFSARTGTYVGGTTDSNSNPTTEDFVCEAANRLRERAAVLEPLTLQERLLLLRMCFLPVLNYLIRTIHPNLTLKGTDEFDRVIIDTVTKWIDTNVRCLPAVSIIHLPTKHGGLGLFSQKQIRKLAFSSSVVLSQSVLRSRSILLTDQTYHHLNDFISLCASNIGLPADNLFNDEYALRPHLQKRACEVVHERTWKDTYTNLSNSNRIRFAEGTSSLAGAWLQALPSDPTTTISDECTRYALRRTLLLPLHQTPNCSVCQCGQNSTTLHHLVCDITSRIRTFRHTYLLNILFLAFQKIGGAEKEVTDGSLRHDICATGVGADRLLIDVGVTTVKCDRELLTPSDQQVQAAIDLQKKHPPNDQLSHEDESDETEPNIETLRLRTFRRLVREKAVSPALNTMLNTKRNRFANNYQQSSAMLPGIFRTFLMTAGGASGQDADKLMTSLVATLSGTARTKVMWRRKLRARVSIGLVRYATRMALAGSRRSMD